MNPIQINELLLKCNTGISNQIKAWLELLRRNVKSLERLYQSYPKDDSQIELTDLEMILSLNRKFLNTGFNFFDNLRDEELERVWQASYGDMISRIPQTAEYSLPYEFYKKLPTDRFKVRVWKSNQRFLWKSRRNMLKLKNRAWSEEQIVEKANNSRSFDQHELLHFFLFIPIRNFLFDEIPEFIRVYAYLIHLNHEIMNLTVRCFRLKDDEESIEELNKLKDLLSIMKTEFEAKLADFKASEAKIIESKDKIFPGISEILEIVFMNAGTFLLPSKLYTGRILHIKEKLLDQQIEKALKVWTQIFIGEKGEWLKDLDMSKTVAVLRRSKNTLLEQIQNRFESNALKKYSAIREAIEGFSQGVNQFKDSSISASELNSQTSVFRKKLREELITDILQQLIHNDLLTAIQNFWEELNKDVEALPQNYSILLQFDLSQEVPNSVTANLALKRIIKEEILQDLKKDVELIKERITRKQNKTIRNISELDNILVYNSEMAIEHLQKSDDKEEQLKAINMIVEAIQRVITLLNESEKNDTALVNEVTESMKKLAQVSGTSLTSFLDPETVSSIRNRITKAMAREQFRKVLFSGLTFLSKYVQIVWKFILRIFSMLLGRYHKIKEMAGIETVSEDVTEHIAHILRESELLFEKLPHIFQKLYENKPVADNRLFVMRKKEIESINKQYRNFKDSHAAKVMIYGETGSGKTSLLNFMRNNILKKERVIDITIDKTITTTSELVSIISQAFEIENVSNTSELAKHLNKLQEPVVLICENFHNLYLRTVGGFGLLNDFLLLMNQTQKKIFWIVTGNKYSWDYLQVVAEIKPHFTRVIDLGNLNAEEIENVITKRQRISGYQVKYRPSLADKEMKAFKKCKTPKDKQKFLAKKFFSRLATASGGNLMVAMQLSLQAIEKVEKDYLIVNADVKVDSSFLNALSEESFYVLTALLQHGVLSIKQTATIFNMKLDNATLIMNSLCDKSIILENEGHYKIHPYLFRPVVQVLTNKNLLM